MNKAGYDYSARLCELRSATMKVLRKFVDELAKELDRQTVGDADNVVFFDRKDVHASMTGYQDARRFSDSVFRFGVPVRVVWFVGTASPLGG